MRNIRDILHVKDKKTLRLEFLLVSTVLIISASTLVYTGLTYEKALQVDNAGGVTPGSGSTGTGLSTGTVLILAPLALVVGLAVFGFLREAYRHVSEGRESLPTGPGPISSVEEGWEGSPSKEEGKQSATTA